MPDLAAPDHPSTTTERPKAVIPYTPRPHFRPVHASEKRWMFVVAHRRAGKTVALVNQLIRGALSNPRQSPAPRYAYIGPSFDQTKDLAWNYLKHYTSTYPQVRYLEGELTVIFPSGATIRLYGGGQAYERLRGIYLDGAVLDEYPLLNPRAWGSVVRPCLADYGGWAIVSGTSNGDDHFHQMLLRAEGDPNWDIFDIKITDTGTDALSVKEVAEMRSDMARDEFAREMMNSFEAPIEGAYYTDALLRLQEQSRITSLPIDLSTPLITGWDIGIHDFTCIWVFQLSGKNINFVDYIEEKGKNGPYYLDLLDRKAKAWGNVFRAHILPHDVAAREWISGESRRNSLMDSTPVPILTADRVGDADGVSAVRGVLGVAFFDESRCRRGLSRLRGYKRTKMGVPDHDDNSHGADAMKTVAVGLPLVTAISSRIGRLRRRIRGLV